MCLQKTTSLKACSHVTSTFARIESICNNCWCSQTQTLNVKCELVLNYTLLQLDVVRNWLQSISKNLLSLTVIGPK